MTDKICISIEFTLKVIIILLPYIVTFYLALKGVIPILYRLGIGLSKKKIAVFALDHEFYDLKKLLLDSKIFNEKNIVQIKENNIEDCENSHIFLVYWKDSKEIFDQIKAKKSKKTSLIVYVPRNNQLQNTTPQTDKSQDNDQLTQEELIAINNTTNASVVNFRGRLLSDILVSMMTTSYIK